MNILIVGGTHGNELTGAYLIKKWEESGELNKEFPELNLQLMLGNPEAFKAVRRYMDEDLNRCFSQRKLDQFKKETNTYEGLRALEILAALDKQPDFIFDLHTTTSWMGETIIITHGNPLEKGLAKFLKSKIPTLKIIYDNLPKEEDHFLTGQGEAGVVVEFGPIPQGILLPDPFFSMEKLVKKGLRFLQDSHNFTEQTLALEVFEVFTSLDFPRSKDGSLIGMIHPDLSNKEFPELRPRDPIFMGFDGKTYFYEGEKAYPIFVNEAAYYEKGVAMALTRKKEVYW